jgi:hypothetical protein
VTDEQSTARPVLTGHPTAVQNYELSDLHRCQQHVEGCDMPAAGTLHAPDGAMIPSGYYCAFHGYEVVEEYAHKLYETWYFRPFDPRALPTAAEEKAARVRVELEADREAASRELGPVFSAALLRRMDLEMLGDGKPRRAYQFARELVRCGVRIDGFDPMAP